MKSIKGNNKAFTLIEVLVVVAIVAILAAAVIIALNPAKALQDTRNSERSSETGELLNAFSQAVVDGDTLSVLPLCTANPLNDQLGDGTNNTVDVNALLVPDYIASVPTDPNGGTAAATGYRACRTNASPVRIRVYAPGAEGKTISVER